jgi:hypothetical protein
MKKLAIPLFTLMFILGMNSMAMAIDDGTYDFFGTYFTEQYDADGKDPHACTLAKNQMSCPETALACIESLVVSTDGGTQTITSGLGCDEFWGVAIAIQEGLVTDIDPDGIGPMTLTVGETGVDEMLSTLESDTMEAGCGEAPCIDIHTYGYDPDGDPGVAGTVKGTLGMGSNVNPDQDPLCAGGTHTYLMGTYTTGQIEVEVDNDNALNQILTSSGSPLTPAGDDYTLKLITPNIRVGGTLLTITYDDTMGWNGLDGTLCQRTSAETSCIPEGFTCPERDDGDPIDPCS